MGKIGYQEGGWLKPEQGFMKFLIRQLIYSIAGATLYFLLSWLNFTTRLPGFSNVTFHPASVTLVLFGVLFGPWVGLLSGVIGKTLADVAAGWGFYWNGSVAYGLIGFVSGFVKIAFPNLRVPRNILPAVFVGALGIFLAATFLSVSASFLGDVDLASAFRAFFWPEFAGNLMVVIILLPLLMVAISAIQRKWKS